MWHDGGLWGERRGVEFVFCWVSTSRQPHSHVETNHTFIVLLFVCLFVFPFFLFFSFFSFFFFFLFSFFQFEQVPKIINETLANISRDTERGGGVGGAEREMRETD